MDLLAGNKSCYTNITTEQTSNISQNVARRLRLTFDKKGLVRSTTVNLNQALFVTLEKAAACTVVLHLEACRKKS